MERYLLFDSSCTKCSQIARAVEQICSGWCAARSLHEPSMQELLGKTNSRWKWEPTLIEVQGASVRNFRGITLRIYLLRALGPKKTWNLLQAMSQTFIPSVPVEDGRRHLLKRGGAILAALALTTGIGTLEPAYAQSNAGDTSTSFSMTPLNAQDPFVQQLQRMDAVKTASKTLGIPDWTSVLEVRCRSSPQAVYVISYQPEMRQEVVKATFLCITNTAKAVVAQLLHTNDQTVQFAWLTPNLHYLGMTTTSKDGKVEASTENPYHLGLAGTSTPDFAWGCFITCLITADVPSWCISICEGCGIFIVTCVACAGCAAGSYAYCVATC